MSTSSPNLPNEAKVILFGNDLTTLSIAYNLSEDKHFCNNCVVITGDKTDDNTNTLLRSSEQQKINSCSLNHLNVFNPRMAQLIQYSKELFDIKTCGSLYLGRNYTTIDSFRRRISSSKIVFNEKTTDKHVEYLTSDDIKRRFNNFLSTDGIKGGLFVPNDGVIEDIVEQKKKLQTKCEQKGIKFFDNYLLNKININNGYVSNVELFDCKTNTLKRIDCHHLINSSNN